jgi:hypothetical protein
MNRALDVGALRLSDFLGGAPLVMNARAGLKSYIPNDSCTASYTRMRREITVQVESTGVHVVTSLQGSLASCTTVHWNS